MSTARDDVWQQTYSQSFSDVMQGCTAFYGDEVGRGRTWDEHETEIRLLALVGEVLRRPTATDEELGSAIKRWLRQEAHEYATTLADERADKVLPTDEFEEAV